MPDAKSAPVAGTANEPLAGVSATVATELVLATAVDTVDVVAAAAVTGTAGATKAANAAADAQYGVTDAADGLLPPRYVTIPNRSTDTWLPLTSNGLINRECTLAVARAAEERGCARASPATALQRAQATNNLAASFTFIFASIYTMVSFTAITRLSD